MVSGLGQHLPFPEAPDQFKRGMELWDSMKTEELRREREDANRAAGAIAAEGNLTGAAQEYYRRGFQEPGAAYAGQQRSDAAAARAAQERTEAAAKSPLELERLRLQNRQLGLGVTETEQGAPLAAIKRQQELEQIERQRAIVAATPGINETAVSDPHAAYEQALKIGGPEAAVPYAGVAKAHAQKLYDFSDYLHDTLSRAETPEQWNATLDGAARVPGVKPEMLAEHRISDPAAFVAEKTRHLQDLDVERGVLWARVNSMLTPVERAALMKAEKVGSSGERTPAQIASAQALIADRQRLGQPVPSLEEAMEIVKKQGRRAELAPGDAAARDKRLEQGAARLAQGEKKYNPELQGTISTEKSKGAELGKIEAKKPENYNKVLMANEYLNIKRDVMTEEIDSALSMMKNSNFPTTGFLGDAASKVKNSDAFNVAEKIKTIKANIGFNELQAMRDSSKTGGALGQVTVQEIEFLQSVLGSLEQGQSYSQISKNLERIKRIAELQKTNRENAIQREFGDLVSIDKNKTSGSGHFNYDASGRVKESLGSGRFRYDATGNITPER